MDHTQASNRILILEPVLPVVVGLIVVELEVPVVLKGHREAKRPVARRRLEEVEVGLPPVQLPREPYHMVVETAFLEVVGRTPARAPILRGPEPQPRVD